MEKPSTLDQYDGTIDLDEHIENVEAMPTIVSSEGASNVSFFLPPLVKA